MLYASDSQSAPASFRYVVGTHSFIIIINQKGTLSKKGDLALCENPARELCMIPHILAPTILVRGIAMHYGIRLQEQTGTNTVFSEGREMLESAPDRRDMC